MTKARTLADFISDGSPLADGAVDVSEVSGAAPLANPTFTGTASGTFSGPLTGDVAGELDLSPIASTIADTAVDVFVYDTSKDSDGGAWRKRTQHTSWYNETLNTATRGSRKEFPSVAVIVAETNQVTIYDGDDPSLPMWMVFTWASGYNLLGYNNRDKTSVTMMNGVLVTGAGTNDGVYIASFIEDAAYRYSSNYSLTGQGIATRTGTPTQVVLGSGLGIVNNYANDVAMTVLPNAPIDAATGLPVPTIAVATNGGVSVIKDDGTVVDITYVNYGIATGVSFIGSDLSYYNGASVGQRLWLHVHDGIPSSDVSGTNGYQKQTFDRAFYVNLVSTAYGHDLYLANSSNTDNNGVVSTSGSGLAVGMQGDGSKVALVAEDITNAANGMAAYVTSSYNTGWMNGDIKLATLSDTDDTDVTGSELVTNGTFDSDTSWTKVGDSTVISGGSATIGNTGAGNGEINQPVSLEAGKVYTITFDVTARNSNSALAIRYNNNVDIVSYFNPVVSSYSFTFTSAYTHTSGEVLRIVSGANTTFTVDNVSVRLAEEDRSVNGNGLQVFGTVTKNPVATGADLVAYGNFSGSNYLEQPYNSDLDFGTGDFSVIYWVKTADIYYTVVDRNDGEGFGLYTTGTSPNSRLRLIIGSTTIDSADTTRLTTDTWTQIVVLRRSSTSVEYYINGTLFDTDVISSSLSASSPSELPTRVGVRSDGAQNLSGSLALLRISATAPSPEQIKKIYEDEKVLFQENAQATLYGSSDAVTALAYDDSTEILSVGTSSGRSDFQGLRRVNNTTNAVGAAISASNGMIVEE